MHYFTERDPLYLEYERVKGLCKRCSNGYATDIHVKH